MGGERGQPLSPPSRTTHPNPGLPAPVKLERELNGEKIIGYIKLQVKAGQANPSPPIGPALGQRGLNIMMFCKDFNAATKEIEPGSPVPVVITYYQDKSFTFEMKTPPASHFLKKAAKITTGSQRQAALPPAP